MKASALTTYLVLKMYLLIWQIRRLMSINLTIIANINVIIINFQRISSAFILLTLPSSELLETIIEYISLCHGISAVDDISWNIRLISIPWKLQDQWDFGASVSQKS